MKRKLVHMPGTRLSPETVLHRTIEKLPRVRAVVVAITWDDGSIDFDWSAQSVANLALTAVSFNKVAQDVCMPDDGDGNVEFVD